MAGKQKNQSKSMGWPQAARDIVIASMNKGQLPILGVILGILIILWRLPSQDLSELVDRLVDMLVKHQIWSYIVNVLLIIGWSLHAKFMRRSFSSEMERSGKEKSDLQSKAAGRRFKSSNNR